MHTASDLYPGKWGRRRNISRPRAQREHTGDGILPEQWTKINESGTHMILPAMAGISFTGRGGVRLATGHPKKRKEKITMSELRVGGQTLATAAVGGLAPSP